MATWGSMGGSQGPFVSIWGPTWVGLGVCWGGKPCENDGGVTKITLLVFLKVVGHIMVSKSIVGRRLGLSWTSSWTVLGPVGGVLGSKGELFGTLGATCCIQVGKWTQLMDTWASMGGAREPFGIIVGSDRVGLWLFGGM